MQLLVMCNFSYATMGSSSCMYHMQLKMNGVQQLQNDSFFLLLDNLNLMVTNVHNIAMWQNHKS
jgi:hypothetical protein